MFVVTKYPCNRSKIVYFILFKFILKNRFFTYQHQNFIKTCLEFKTNFKKVNIK